MSKIFCLVIIAALLANQFQPVRTLVITGAMVWAAVSVGYGVYKLGRTIMNGISTSKNNQELKANIGKIQKGLAEINQKIDSLAEFQDQIIDYIRSLPDLFQYYMQVRDLEKCVTRLSELHKLYVHYLTNTTKFANHTLLDFAETVVSYQPQESVVGTLNQIHGLIVPLNHRVQDRSVLGGVAEYLKPIKFDDLSKLNQSPQQMLLSFYSYLVQLKTEGTAMRLFAYMLLKTLNRGEHDKIVETIGKSIDDEIKTEVQVLKDYAIGLPREYWRGDPPVHVENETYVEITNFHTLYVENRVHFESHEHCPYACGGSSVLRQNYTYNEPLWKNQRKCGGTLYNCFDHGYLNHLIACLPKENTHRRYYTLKKIKIKRHDSDNWPEDTSQWIRHTDFGKRCPINHNQLNFAEWQPAYGRWCSYCFCRCNEEGIHSDRYFNLRPVLADFKHNRVVTGVKFTKHNQIIRLQIQEGVLLPGGIVNKTTVRWVPPENYNIGEKEAKEGQDYHTLTLKQKTMIFDTVHAKRGDVIIGVRIMAHTNNKYLRLAIATSSFNVISGKLTGKLPNWIHNSQTSFATRLKPFQDVPYYSRTQSVPSKFPSYLTFESSFESHDAGQSTVPAFDAQPVELPFPAALESMGLYHKGHKGAGGFIAPLISHYNFIEYL